MVLPPRSKPIPFTWNNFENEQDNLIEIEIEGITREYILD